MLGPRRVLRIATAATYTDRVSKPVIANVLASRYASADLAELWSASTKIELERRLWIAVLKAQRDLGIDVPADAIADYERVVDQVDLASIAERERVTRHDVKARIEEFNALAGHEQIHKGMTSRDLTENVEQLQILRSLEHVHAHGVAVLARIVARASGATRGSSLSTSTSPLSAASSIRRAAPASTRWAELRPCSPLPCGSGT